MSPQVYRLVCFLPEFLLCVLPQCFYDSVLYVCRCFNRGCSFLSDAAASSSTLGSCATWFSTGSSVLLLPCEFTFLWSILLRLQMGYSFATCISWSASASGFYLCSARLRFTCPALLFSLISYHVGRCHIESWLRGLCVTCFIYGSDWFLLLEECFYMQIMCCNIIKKHSSLPRIRLSPFVIIMFSSHYGNITKIIFWYEFKILWQAR